MTTHPTGTRKEWLAARGPDAVAIPGGDRVDRQDANRAADRDVGAGYFFVWTMLGMAAFALGVALAAVEMQQPAPRAPFRSQSAWSS